MDVRNVLKGVPDTYRSTTEILIFYTWHIQHICSIILYKNNRRSGLLSEIFHAKVKWSGLWICTLTRLSKDSALMTALIASFHFTSRINDLRKSWKRHFNEIIDNKNHSSDSCLLENMIRKGYKTKSKPPAMWVTKF